MRAQVRASKSPQAGQRAPPGRRALTPKCSAAAARDGAFFDLRFPSDPLRPARAPRPHAAAAVHPRTPTTARRRAALPDRVRARAGRGRRADRGLHFDDALLDALPRAASSSPTSRCTSAPAPSSRCGSSDLAEHVMHSEWLNVGAETVEAIARTRARGGRVVAVGTTSCARWNRRRARGALRGRQRGETRHLHLARLRVPASSTR